MTNVIISKARVSSVSALNPVSWISFTPAPACLHRGGIKNSCFLLCPWAVSRKRTWSAAFPHPLGVCLLMWAEWTRKCLYLFKAPLWTAGLYSWACSPAAPSQTEKLVPLIRDLCERPHHSRDKDSDDLTCPQTTCSYLYSQDSVWYCTAVLIHGSMIKLYGLHLFCK